MTRVVELVVAARADAWRHVGLHLAAADDGLGEVAVVGGVRLRIIPPRDGTGLRRWVLSGDAPCALAIDGVPTQLVRAGPPLIDGAHRLRARRIDHVVVLTPSLERTCAALEAATGEPLRRVREAGGGVRQGFHRFGDVTVEVVERSHLPADAPATLWGFVLDVDDLHEVARRLGPEVLSPPKPAVQPGRFISSFRVEAGLGLPVALMTPEPQRR